MAGGSAIRGSRVGAGPMGESARGDLDVEIGDAELPAVQSGRFGADMQVSLINDGPVTIWLED